MRTASLAWLLLLMGAPAAAQSLHVIRAPLSVDGDDVGELWGAPVRLAGWEDDRRPLVRYADRDVRMRAAIDLAADRSYVVAGVGRAVTLRTDAPFRIEMRPSSWAPLAGRAPNGLRILLPEGLPAREAVLGPSRAVPSGAEPPAEAFSHAGAPPSFDASCGTLALRARPRADAATWTVDGSRGAVHAGPQRDGFTRARFFVDGFVVHGWIEGALPTCEPVIQGASFGTGCGDGYGQGIVVTLPAGTDLYASETATRPFATLRRAMVGIEPLHRLTARACANGVCERMPPEPRGASRWILHSHRDDGGGWLLTAWVRTPAEQLARPADGSSAFGGCWAPPSGWPGED